MIPKKLAPDWDPGWMPSFRKRSAQTTTQSEMPSQLISFRFSPCPLTHSPRRSRHCLDHSAFKQYRAGGRARSRAAPGLKRDRVSGAAHRIEIDILGNGSARDLAIADRPE